MFLAKLILSNSLDLAHISTLILDYIKVLVWPVTLYIITTTFRREIAAVLENRMTEITTPLGSAKFQLPVQNTPTGEVTEEIKEEIETTVSNEPAPATTSIDMQQELANLQTALLFERVYNTIYGSQLTILDALRKSVEGLWYAAISTFYENHKQTDPLL